MLSKKLAEGQRWGVADLISAVEVADHDKPDDGK
jgi:hypothetical protein